MRSSRLPFFTFFCVATFAFAQQWGTLPMTEWQQRFRSDLSVKVEALTKANAIVSIAPDGWLFLRSELRFLTLERFWGTEAAKVGASPNTSMADPVPAILDFRDQLKQRGIELLLVPIPAKAAIYPERAGSGTAATSEDAAPFLHEFYTVLRAQGVDVLDLTELFLSHKADEKGAMYCRSDTHWSGVGCALAAQAIAEKVRSKVPPSWPTKLYASDWQRVVINGDLVPLLPPGSPRLSAEEIAVRLITEKTNGAGVQPDQNSPVLLLGDSHTLVFHDFLCDKAGLVDQLALELGFAPDLIGTRGSGATPVRVTLYRDSSRNPEYLAKKKVVVWCFTAREFSEADQGWRKLPIGK